MGTSFAQLCFQLDEFHKSDEARPLHIYSVFPRIKVNELSDVAREAKLDAIVKELGKNVYELEIVSGYKRKSATGYLVDFKDYWIIFIKTIESSSVAGGIAKRWLDRMYPAISLSYIKPSELLNITDNISKIENSKLEPRGYVLRARDKPETTKKWPRGSSYSRETIENTMNYESKLLEAINFIFSTDGTFFEARIGIDGHSVFYRGGSHCFSNFQRLILSSYNETALINKNFFSNRERQSINGDIKISQISLKPKEKLSKEDLEALRLHLGVAYSIAVYHSGNPWLSMNTIDRGDGSSFDIYGYPSEIRIVPFNKAAPESLMKLYYNISEIFPLAELKET